MAIQPPGDRHAALLQSTNRLASLVKGGTIDEATALAKLHEAARVNGLAAEGRAHEVEELWASAMGRVDLDPTGVRPIH